MPTFDAGAYLADHGLTPIDSNGDGTFRVQDTGGNIKTFDLKGFMKDAGIGSSDYQLNTPDTASDVSGVSAIDRLKMSVGNARGSLNYLKSKYDDVQFVPNQGLTVKKNGLWQKVDPSGWGGGDAWDKTKEVAKDLFADTGDIALNVAGTTAAIAAAPETGGASILAAGAGGGISGAIRTSLGRLAGTYDSTPEEQVKDIGLESLLSAGGQAIALGAKPVFSKIKDAVTGFADSAAPAVRETMANLLHVTAGIEPENAQRLFNRSGQVMGTLDTAIENRGADGVEAALKDKGIGQVRGLFKDAGKALGQRFDAAENDLLKTVPKDFSANVGDTVKEAFSGLQQLGVLKLNDAGKYVIGDEQALSQLLQHPEGNGALSLKAMQKLREFVNLGNKFTDAGTIQGQDGVKAMLNIRRAMDKFYYTATRANPDVKEVLTPVSSQVRNNLVNSIKAVSDEAAAKYAAMNNLYVDMMPHVAQADRIVKSYKGPETFINQIMKPGADNRISKGLVDIIAQLKGDTGQKIADSLKDTVAARDFISRWPKNGLVRAGGTLGAAALAHNPAAGALVIAAGAPISSPRVVGRAVQYGSGMAEAAIPYAQKFLDTLKGMTPQAMQQLIKNPDLFNAMVRTTVTAPIMEKQQTEQLLQQAGVK